MSGIGPKLLVLAVAAFAFAAFARAADCGDSPEGFKAWLDAFDAIGQTDSSILALRCAGERD
jgi:hypothetical protein